MSHNLKRRYSLLVEFEADSEPEAMMVKRAVQGAITQHPTLQTAYRLEVEGPYDMTDEDPRQSSGG